MSAATLNLVIEQKAAFSRRLVWKDKNGKRVDLTGYTAKLQIKNLAGDVAALFELNTSNGRIALGGKNGQIDLSITGTDTAGITSWTKGVYDLVLTSAGGVRTRLIEGSVKVSPGVTTLP